MAYLIDMNQWFLIAAFVIGFATGAWIWARRCHRVEFTQAAEDAPLARTLDRTATPPEPAASAPAAPPIAGTADAVLSGAGASDGDAPSPFLTAPWGDIDDLMRLKGVGPKLNALLGELGVFHYHQIASWSDGHVTIVDERLGSFRGRIERDRWREQARLLAEGKLDEFEQRFGSGAGGAGQG